MQVRAFLGSIFLLDYGKEMARVSVVMAVYNGERYLREAVDSILEQTFTDFEFLIIDDGSTDGTQGILRAYEDSRIRVLVNEQNAGLTRSLNRGLQAARGEFIARQDADDVSEPERLEKQIAFLDANPEVALLGSWYSIIDTQSNYQQQIRPPCEHREICWDLLFYCPFVHSAVMLRRELVLREVGPYDESYGYSQDYDWWCRIADALPVANLPEYLVRYRVHGISMTSKYPNAEREFLWLRLARIISMLSPGEPKLQISESHPAAMTCLYLGWAASFEPAVLNQAVEIMLKLQRVFLEKEGFTPQEMTPHRDGLRLRIAANLVMLTVFCSSTDLRVRSKLLARAWRLNPRVLLRPRSLIRAGRAIAGAYIPALRLAPAVGP